ncbi:MAG: prepilin peptidase, partial [Candidatus Nitrotoga sp.]
MTAFIELLQSLPFFFIILCGIIGLLVGSFLNVVIHRLPKMMEREWHAQCAELTGNEPANVPPYNLFMPHSACPH